MEKEIISEKEGISLSLLFIMNEVLILPVGFEAHKDIWISIILATSLGILTSFIYTRILYCFPGKSLFDISEIIFGTFIGKIVSLLYILFAFHLASLVFADYVQFVGTVSFTETPRLIIIAFPALFCILGLKLGLEGIGRFAKLVYIPICIFIFIWIVILIPKMHLDYLLPIFEDGVKPIVKGTFSLFSFPFSETVIFMCIFDCFKRNKSICRVYIISILLAGVIILLTKTVVVSVLGIDLYTRHYFPTYAAARRAAIGESIQRIEIIVGLMFSVGGLVKVSVCMLAVCKGICSVLCFDDFKFLVTPIVLLNVAFVFIAYKDITQLSAWHLHIWKYYSFPFQVIIPIIMLALSKIRKN